MTNLPIKQDVAVVPTTPKEQIQQASEMAKLLKEVVNQAGLSKKLGGRKEHLEYEAWATIARWFNCTPITEWTKPIKDGDKIIGWEARVNVVDKEGRIIGASEGMCMGDEQNWRNKPTYALRSMAQTRTAGKALRSLFAHIAVLAGYSPTPAEEMDGVEIKPETKSESKPQSDELASDSQRKAFFAKCMARWNERTKAKAFADYLLSTIGAEHFTKKYISECLNDFDNYAIAFDEEKGD